MSDKPPRDLTLEGVNRLTVALADLSESHAVQGRQFIAAMQRLSDRLDRIEAQVGCLVKDVHALASKQALLGNRFENAFLRGLHSVDPG
jgi:hypothetical protein